MEQHEAMKRLNEEASALQQKVSLLMRGCSERNLDASAKGFTPNEGMF